MAIPDHGSFQIPIHTVDAFTETPFSGNPAAVCVLEEPLGPDAMQRIAAEMNLSETAFVHPLDGPSVGDEGHGSPGHGADFALRWFTPEREVPLCGHATLATAHVLFETSAADGPLSFSTASGIVTVERGSDGLVLDFPSDPPRVAPPPNGLLRHLGCPEDAPTFSATVLWMVRMESDEAVRQLDPDFRKLRGVDIDGRLGVVVTAPGGSGPTTGEGDPPSGSWDMVSRVFAPWSGIDEDPVTGVAHTVVGPYWSQELGKAELRAYQASERGGDMTVRPLGERIRLEGKAVTVARGTIRSR